SAAATRADYRPGVAAISKEAVMRIAGRRIHVRVPAPSGFLRHDQATSHSNFIRFRRYAERDDRNIGKVANQSGKGRFLRFTARPQVKFATTKVQVRLPLRCLGPIRLRPDREAEAKRIPPLIGMPGVHVTLLESCRYAIELSPL